MQMQQSTGLEHVLSASVALAADTAFAPVLQTLGLDLHRVCESIHRVPAPEQSLQAAQLVTALDVAWELGEPLIEPVHLLLAVTVEPGPRVEQLLASLGLTRRLVYGMLRADCAAGASWRGRATLSRVAAPAQVLH